MQYCAAKWFSTFVALLFLGFLTAAPHAAAQGPDADQPGQSGDDPPARAARLSYTGGSVSFEPAGTDDWVGAVVNRPLTTGDKLWTDRDGRAELRIDSYAVRLGPQTGFSFLNLDDQTVQIRLTEGSLNVRVRRFEENQTLEIDTPNLAFNVLRAGTYRINVNENGDTTVVSVKDGQGEVTGGGSAYPIHAGQSATFTGTDQLNADMEGFPQDDDFDRWCGDRDRRWDGSASAKYVSDDVVGYEDLDEYGGWRPVPDYGTVWFPHTTVVGWAPYRYGHWVWVSPWGWTWVDDAPWGFAPFHYGRWVVVGGVWGWVPVRPRPAVVTVAYVRPVYAPALVAWVGGPHWGVGVGVGGVAAGVAWFPLGPRDVYCPSYHVSKRYVERVNVSNTVIVNRTQVTNVYNNVYVNRTVNVTNVTYQNQRYNNAVTATSQASFTTAQPVGRNMVRVDAREVSSAPVAPLTPNVAPQQRSFVGAGAEARVRPPANALARPVVAKTTPPPAPVSVNRQMQAVQANGGRPVAEAQIRQTDTPRPNVRIAPTARPAAIPVRSQGAVNGANNGANNPPNANVNNGRPPAVNQPNQPQPQTNVGRPPVTNSANPNINQPGQTQPQPNVGRPPASNPTNPNANQPPNSRPYNDRPPTSRPAVDPQVQQRQQQQLEKLHQQQDNERQKVEQKQVQQQQKLDQQKANDLRVQQAQQKQQQQLQQLEQKHGQQQQKLQQRQEQEVQKHEQQKPNNNSKPPKSDNKDKPH
jgi:hypothetical protein